MVHELGRDAIGEHGLSSVGAVTGATRPDLLHHLRELMPRAIFLLPGVGAQGGSASDLGPAWETHPAGGLIASSRSIVGAHEQRGGDPAQAAHEAAEELRAAAWEAATGP
jgi:orotidine-5'-phosphate decarboxylase